MKSLLAPILLTAVAAASVPTALVLSSTGRPLRASPPRPGDRVVLVPTQPTPGLPPSARSGTASTWPANASAPTRSRSRPRVVPAASRPPVRRLALHSIGGSSWSYFESDLPPFRRKMREVERKIRGEDGADPEIWASFPDFEFERLTLLFPETPGARSFAEYAEIRGGTYFGYRWLSTPGDFKYDPEREIPGFLAWIERYPGHPGLDDACYRLGRCYGIRGDYAEALRWFHRARSAPDGDIGHVAEVWANLLLDAFMSEGELMGYVHGEGSAEAAYALGLRRFRDGDFEGAVSWMEWALHGLPAQVGERVGEQMKAVREVAILAEAVRRAEGEEERARSLYEVGRRQYHDRGLYESVLWGRYPRPDRRYALMRAGVLRMWGHNGAPAAIKEAFMGIRSRLHARRTFLALAESCPGSPLVPAARYSAATALAHTASGHPVEDRVACRTLVRRQVAREYRQLARDFPESSLADDALFHAGLLSGREEAFRELLRLHPEGDRREAAEEMLEEGLPESPGLADVPGLIDELERNGWSAYRAARQLERVLGVCARRIPGLPDEERARAIDDLASWFRAVEPKLEFDRDAGGYVLR